MSFEKSIKAMEHAEKLMPGGVNSPVRAFKSVDTPAIFMDHGEGSKIYDIDGNEYIDYVLSWGPLILGHKNQQVISKLHEAVDKGTSFGASTLQENKLAELVIDRVPSIEKVRMVSSGTEATLDTLRLARGYTGRNKIIKFEGCYHGHSDSLLIKAGSGVATLGFAIAMDERTTGSGSASSLLGLLQSLLGGLVTPLVNLKGEYNSTPYLIIISIAALALMMLQIVNYFVFKKSTE